MKSVRFTFHLFFTVPNKMQESTTKHDDSEDSIKKIKSTIKNILSDDEECYKIRLANKITKEDRMGPSIQRSRLIEKMCFEHKSLFPLVIYCGVRSLELDDETKSNFGKLVSYIQEVIYDNLTAYPSMNLAIIEEAFRKGNCGFYLIATKPKVIDGIKMDIRNARGEECEWYYNIVYGIPELLRKTLNEEDCACLEENMERLKKAGFVCKNSDEIQEKLEILQSKMVNEKMKKDQNKKKLM